MNSTKCTKCGLTNFVSDIQCKRCGEPLGTSNSANSDDHATTRTFTLGKILALAVAAAIAYYAYTSYSVPTSENMQNPTKLSDVQVAPETRAEMDRQKSQRIANAVGVAPGLNAHENRTRETDRIMNSVSNTAPKP